MDYDGYLTELEAHGGALADAAERAGLDATPPTCPLWTVRELVDHVGLVHRWATAAVRGERDPALEHAPDDDPIGWFRAGHATLLETLRATPADTPARAFLAGAPNTVLFWARRQAHETAIHRADAESARTATPAYDPDFALDGIGELLEGFYGRRGGRLLSDPPFALRVAPSDADVTWLVRVGPDERSIERDGDGPADCTLTGSSPALYAHLWNRDPATPVRVDGDAAVPRRWRELATVAWS